MIENVGTVDSQARLVIGMILLELVALGMIGPWAYLGFIPLVTGMSRKCPLYEVLGIDTTPGTGHDA